MPDDSIKKILIVRLGGIGDVVCTLPAVEALRAGFPNATIDYAVEEPAFDIVNGHPALNMVHRFARRRIVKEFQNPFEWSKAIPELKNYIHSLRDEQYDLALDFQRNLKGAVHTLFSKPKRKVGFAPPTAREGNQWFYREKVDPAPAVHWVDKFLAIAVAVGGKREGAKYRLPDSPESNIKVDRFLSEHNLPSFIVLHPSASSFDPNRLWEPERFGALANRIVEKWNIPTVVSWGPTELARAEKGVRASNGAAILNEKSSLLDLAELYRRAKLYIGCDTGPMHIATAVGLPSAVLFGSGNPAAYGPRSAGSRIISKMENQRLVSLSHISVEEVFRVVQELLEP